MKPLILIFFVFITLSSFCQKNENSLSESELKQKSIAFINAKNKRQQPNSTPKDIEHFLSYIADNFVDEHIKFNVTVTSKEDLRKGMIAKLADKVYFSKITIEQLMVGGNVVMVKYTEHAKVKPSHLEEIIEYTSANILSLEFNNLGLITHIRRHHGVSQNPSKSEHKKTEIKKTQFLGLRTTIYKIADIAKAKKWYSEAFGIEPYFDQPFYVGFNIGGFELGLQPEKEPTKNKTESVVTYWGVSNIDETYKKLIELGATENEKPYNVGGEIVTATVKDPFGNVIGIIYNPEFKLKE